MAKKSYVSEIIEQITTLLNQTKTYASAETYDAEALTEARASINAALIMAIFGAEIAETKQGLALKMNKKPANLQELSQLEKLIAELVDIESELITTEDDIPGATSAAISQLAPEKVTKKNLSEYLLNGPQAVGRLAIGPTDILVLANLSAEYRKRRKNQIILVSVIAAAAIAAGITTTVIIAANKNKAALEDADDLEDDEEPIEDDTVTEDTDAPHVEIDM